MIYFLDYFSNLDALDVILIMGGIIVIIVVVIISMYLYKKNKQLVNMVNNQKEIIDEAEQLQKNYREKQKELQDKLIEIKENNIKEEKILKEISEKVDRNNKQENFNKIINNRNYQTSPINIEKKEEIIEKRDNISFTEQLAKKMEEEIKPQTIELTDFEKKQEDEAIISYQELLSSSKDKVYQITDDEETTNFLEELKSFRSEL